MKIYPSLISADILNLELVLTQLNPLCDGYHIDIMDGHFVPNITWGPVFSNAIAKKTDLPLDIHLMVSEPTTIAARLEPREQDCITFHYEAVKNPSEILPIIAHIKNMHCRVGVAVSPETPAQAVLPYLTHLDELTIMTVKPGASGQAFIPSMHEKIMQLVAMKASTNPRLKVMVDGGVGVENIVDLAKKGVNACAVASAIFSAFSPTDAIKHLNKLAK